MTDHAPYIIVAPYLPLKKAAEVANWAIGPIDAFAGKWKDAAFEKQAKAFVAKFRDADGKDIKNPALICSVSTGLDGKFPSAKEIEALQLALHFGSLDANPSWQPDADGWWVATSDNSDIWAQPIDVASGRIALGRGSLVTVTSGGWKTDDPKLEIRAPLELHLPLEARFLPDVASGIYHIAIGDHDDVHEVAARRIATAVRWLAKAWRNTPSLGPEDRIVMLRTAFEAFTGTSDATRAIKTLDQTFAALKDLGATKETTEHLLWSPDDVADRAFSYVNREGKPKTVTLTDLGHWFSSFGSARHQVVHEGLVPAQTYEEPDSAYNGPFFHVGERLLREAVRASLVRFGYEELWKTPFARHLPKLIEAALQKKAAAESSAPPADGQETSG